MTGLAEKLKKPISTLMLLMMMMIGCCSCLTPYTASADGNVKIEDLDISMKDNGIAVSGNGVGADSKGAWNNFFNKYKKFIIGISGVGAITMVGCFIVCFMKLGASAGNPQARQQALTGVLWSGIAAAGLGAVTFIVGIFYSSLK